jgi:hypothetical protein
MFFAQIQKSPHESFDQTFSKVCAGRGRKALVASAEAKSPKRRSLICVANMFFFLAAT